MAQSSVHLATSEPSYAESAPKQEFLAYAKSLQSGNNPYFGTHQLAALRRQIAGNLEPGDRVALHGQLCFELLRVGDTQQAIQHADQAMQIVAADPSLQGMLADTHRMRALAYLRGAEIENCVTRHNGECCIFPLQRGGIHDVRQPAETAAQEFLNHLHYAPGDLKSRWLLNISHMALGTYPDGVPESFRIAPSTFESNQQVARFVNRAPLLGVDTFNLCGGSIVDDFDRDGLMDIVTSTWDPSGPMVMYHNTGSGGFEDVSSRWRVDQQLGGLNCINADYDNDGDVDVLVLRGAWLFADGQMRNSLLRNEGDGRFVDVTHQAGLAKPARPTQTAAWADFDNDGDLDLYIGNESRARGGVTDEDFPSQLFRNNGDGTFADIARDAGVTNDRYCKGVSAGDFDNDGDQDIYVSNIAAPNRLYRNNGDLTFTDIAADAGVTRPRGRCFATWFFDYDNDGWLDLFVSAYDASVEDVAADYLDMADKATRPCLYHNNRDGTFTDVARAAGLDHAYLPMGANFGDIDHDGWLDIYLTTGDPGFGTLVPNVMLRNVNGQRFEDVTFSAGLGHLQKGHGVAFADIDNDGDQDIYHQLGGFYPGDRFRNALFENTGNPDGPNRFLYVSLSGAQSNRAGVGARIRIDITTPGGSRSICRAVGSVSSFGGSPLRQEIGLADATGIDRLEVFWPASGRRRTYANVPLDTWVTVYEGAERFALDRLTPIRLGDAHAGR